LAIYRQEQPSLTNVYLGRAGDLPEENDMPAFVIPVLIGIPVIVGGGYLLVRVFH
jgi:hypothetical protein